LGRYCASVDDEEIADGLKIVERQLGEKTVRAGEHELFKARAKEKGQVKLIDIITARLDAGTDSFVATLPSLQLKDVRISEAMVHANERMLTGGFYAEVNSLTTPLSRRRRMVARLALKHCAKSNSQNAKCCRRCIRAGRHSPLKSGRIS
jgi:predicted ATP-dependent Lon-type protease